MKKSILASLVAGLFAFGAIAGDEHSTMKIEMLKLDGDGTTINLNTDGTAHVFEFTEDEAKDLALVESRLADVDEKTREAVLKALSGNHGFPKMMFISDEDIEIGDKRVFVKHLETIEGEDGKNVVIKLDGDGDFGAIHKIIEKHHDGFAFKFRTGENHTMDGDHAAKAIEKLLKHSELSQQQLDQIQALLDEKR